MVVVVVVKGKDDMVHPNGLGELPSRSKTVSETGDSRSFFDGLCSNGLGGSTLLLGTALGSFRCLELAMDLTFSSIILCADIREIADSLRGSTTVSCPR